MSKKYLKVTGLVVLALILAVAGFAFWLFRGNLTDAKIKVFKAVPVPFALVDSEPLYVKDFLARFEMAKKASTEDEGEIKKQVKEGMVNEQKLNDVAKQHGINVSEKELNDEFQNIASESSSQGDNISDFLNSFGLNEQSFKQVLLKPQILGSKLITWYNSQKELNNDAYAKAQEVENKVRAGEDFGKLAATYSQDPTSQSMEGDMGFIKVGDLLPELKEGIDGMQPGQTRLLSSRYGLHMVLLVEKNNQDGEMAHLKQIYIKTDGFEQWFDNQTKNIKVRNLINL